MPLGKVDAQAKAHVGFLLPHGARQDRFALSLSEDNGLCRSPEGLAWSPHPFPGM